MVLVLFLVSVGVLEVILRWPRVAPPQKQTAHAFPASEHTGDLLSLANALGSSVPSEASPKIAGPTAETVEKSRSSRLD